ncbi:metallopeptidase family protein [Butyricicoccus sp. Marseille-Q5471]|uniref:metallopeptidase family protein n=1 Tax=Butyricicoccus sp. Marseille-Q5471 TaxID=3039493 RepID=UPI0024BC67A3|nr:metallopeptidase family protein [Butyricicoccus sp. Marseille-Q5471]
MISIDEFEDLLDEIAQEIPPVFFEELNGGILVDPGHPCHPESVDGNLYIMGEYRVHPAMGKYIVIYYGSFRMAYSELPLAELRGEMRRVLLHEFRHHVEGRAGLRDLEIFDAEQIAGYKAEHKKEG